MLHYADTTVFNVGAQTIVNTVNCVGVMGNGLALECRLRYPDMFADYVVRCQRGTVRIGAPYLYRADDAAAILNFPAKHHWKFPSRLEWIRLGLESLVKMIPQEGITSLAIPPLGCDLGKLEWADVQPLMTRYLGELPLDVIVCFDREENASGVEGKMVAMLNDPARFYWTGEGVLSRCSIRQVLTALPIKRFRDLRKVTGVGRQTYETLFRRFYARACRESTSGALSRAFRQLTNGQFHLPLLA